MNTDIKYINEVQLDDIKWRNLLSTYSTGEEVEKSLRSKAFTNIEDFKTYSKELYNIEKEIEHQSSLWPVTPFALIFLGRNLEKIEKLFSASPKVYRNVAEKSLEIFALISGILKEDYFEHFDKEFAEEFPDEIQKYDSIEDIMNTKEILELAEEEFEDEEEYIEELCEIVTSDDVLFDSVIHYTDMVIREFIPTFKKFAKAVDRDIKEIAEEILDNLDD